MFPRFPAFKELNRDDRALVSTLLYRAEPEVSELSFGSLYSWRRCCNTSWCLLDGTLLFIEQGEDGAHYLLPPVGSAVSVDLVRELLFWLRDTFPLSQPTIERAGFDLIQMLDETFCVTPQPDEFDYLYRRTAIAELQGSLLRDKRRTIRKLTHSHTCRATVLLPDHLPQCRRVNHEWQQWRCRQIDPDEADAANACLDQFEQLQLEGTVIMVDDRIEAFSISEPLNSTTMVVHVERASPRYPELFAFLVWQSCRQYQPQIGWVNRAQDRGLPGLKQAKRSWCPARMIEKFRILLRYP